MKSFIKVSAYLVLAVILLLAASFAVCFVYPDVAVLKKKNPEKTSFMKYREKQWENKGLDKKIKQKWVSFSRISPYVVKAVIIAEDDKFWRHEGFDFVAMQKAFEQDIKKKKFKVGGSTISQQLAKNLFLTPAKNPLRKIKEAVYTWRLEKNLSKKRIIELYLNVAEWGDAIFGIEAAARKYYGKSASSLGPEEAARLATVLPNPIRFSPVGNSRYVANRSAIIYRIMVRRGIVIEEYVEVMNSPQEDISNEEGTDEETGSDEGVLTDTSGPDVPDAAQRETVPETKGEPAPDDNTSKDNGEGNEES
ncbi:MAG TPA: monofunctional biosynthetic peptidoglycan transglycosylase [Desulfomonilia bacterium]